MSLRAKHIYKIEINIAWKCASDGHLIIPWGHGRGFVNDPETT